VGVDLQLRAAADGGGVARGRESFAQGRIGRHEHAEKLELNDKSTEVDIVAGRRLDNQCI
jgi:hypothetical protein